MDPYRLLKLVHVVSVTLWVGGSFALSVLIWSLARSRDLPFLAATLRLARVYGRAFVGPASVLTLLTGMGMLWVLGISPEALWVRWGFVGIVGHFLIGTTLLRRANERLRALASSPTVSGDALASARRRLTLVNSAYLALLLSVVGVMTVKPVL